VLVHVDATDLYEAATPELAAEAARRQELVFLALDLVSGRVRPGHPLHAWLLGNGAEAVDLDRFAADPIELDLVGINLYPLFSLKRLVQSPRGLRIRMPYAGAEIVDRLAALYWHRYQQPLLVSETASEGSVRRRLAWLESSVEAVRRVRGTGIPLVGYTWWPLFALVSWGYREGHKAPEDYLRQMGLWDLRPGATGLERVPTALVERYRNLAAGGAQAVGLLHSRLTERSRDHVS